MLLRNPNLGEAVMEVKPEQGSSHPGVPSNGFLQYWHDDLIDLRTWELVELWEKTKLSSNSSTMASSPEPEPGMGEAQWCWRKKHKEWNKTKTNSK